MAGIQDFWEFVDDFDGAGLFGAATAYDPWVATLAGTTPTVARVDHGETAGIFRPGVVQLAMAGTDANNANLSFGDVLSYDINTLRGFECGLRFVAGSGGAKDTTTTAAWGVSGDINAAIDTMAVAAIFRLASTSTDHALVVEVDDTTSNTVDDVATGLVMADLIWWKFKIDFSNLADVKFYAGPAMGQLARVAASTVLNMSGYAAGVQPFFQLQKTTDTNVDKLQVDYVRLWGVRNATNAV